MASHPRYFVLQNHSYFHVTWKCHNNDFLLHSSWAKKKYLALLEKYKEKYGVQLIANCIMSNHPHLVGYVDVKENLSDFFKTVNSQFALYFNKRTNRSGQVVKDRFHCSVIATQADLLKVMLYVDLNPKRAFIVKHPKDYQWSSYKHYAEGIKNPLIEAEPECYTNLGDTPEERQKKYREMIEYILMNDWKDKQSYSEDKFIGNPDWVTARYIELKQEMKKRKQSQVPVCPKTEETG